MVFESPAEIEPTGSALLSVFLYQIVANDSLGNTEPVFSDTTLQYPPLIFDLYYMFIPYAKDRETELLIMEELMQVFNATPVLRKDILQGNLVEAGNDVIRITPNNFTFEEINKFWERFPDKSYKLSVSYILSPVKIPSAKESAKITRVVKKDINVYRQEAGK